MAKKKKKRKAATPKPKPDVMQNALRIVEEATGEKLTKPKASKSAK